MYVEKSFDWGKTWKIQRYFAVDCDKDFPGIHKGKYLSGVHTLSAYMKKPVLRIRIRVPGSGSVAFLTTGSWIRDGQKLRIRIRDSASGMNDPDHIS
jgi:hypothetical protein